MGAVDIFLVYSFLRRLVQHFDEWEAFKLGVIDREGNVLIPPPLRTREQRRSLGYYDVMLMNLKKLLQTVPGGSTRIASLAAAIMLLKEPKPKLTEQFVRDNLDAYQQQAQLWLEDAPTTNTAGIASPPVPLIGNRKKLKDREEQDTLIAESSNSLAELPHEVAKHLGKVNDITSRSKVLKIENPARIEDLTNLVVTWASDAASANWVAASIVVVIPTSANTHIIVGRRWKNGNFVLLYEQQRDGTFIKPRQLSGRSLEGWVLEHHEAPHMWVVLRDSDVGFLRSRRTEGREGENNPVSPLPPDVVKVFLNKRVKLPRDVLHTIDRHPERYDTKEVRGMLAKFPPRKRPFRG